MISAKWIKGEDTLFAVAFVDDAAAGAGVINLCESANGVIELGPIAVDATFCDQGINELLLRMMIRRAYNMGYLRQTVKASCHNEALYRSLGFARVNEDDDTVIMYREGDIGGC